MTLIGKRWVPAIAISAVIAGVALVAPFAANASASLPDKSPAEVLDLVQQNRVSALSGTIEQKADLGIPAIPSGLTASNAGLASALELLTGTHRARVFLNGPKQARVQVLDRLGERDAIRNGNDVWLYSSDKHAATHITLPDKAAAPHAPALTPAQLAKRFLAAIDPSTTVTVGKDVTVAGRSAYNLVLTPRSSDTLVGSVSIAVDGRTGLPLGVTVKARGQEDPALSVAFTVADDRSTGCRPLLLLPAEGRHGEGACCEGRRVKEHAVRPPTRLPHGAAHPAVKVTGSGWASIAEVPASKLPASITGFETARRAEHLRQRRAPLPHLSRQHPADAGWPGIRRLGARGGAPGRGGLRVVVARERRILDLRAGDRDPCAEQALRAPARGERHRPRRAPRLGVRLPRPERVGQDHDDPHAARAGRRDERRGAVLGGRSPATCRMCSRGSARSSRAPVSTPTSPGRANLHRLDVADRYASSATRRARVDAALDRVGLTHAAEEERARVLARNEAAAGHRERAAVAARADRAR